MGTLGMWLRQTREAKSVTLKEAEAATRIRARFLEWLETGDFAAFPGGDVQIRGFLRIYARYLGLSPDEVLARYDADIPGSRPAPAVAPIEAQPAPPARPAAKPAAFQPPAGTIAAPTPRWMRPETWLIVGIAVIAILLIVTGIAYVISRNVAKEPTATISATHPVGNVPAGTVTATVTLPAVTPTFLANPGGGVAVSLEATEHVWVRVTTDGVTTFEGMLAPGQIETWTGEQAVIVDTGNGAGLQVTVNGQLQGVMGERDQVTSRGWGPSGEIAVPPPSP